MHTAPRPQSPVSPKWGHRLCPHCVSVCNVCLYVCMSFPCLGCHPRFACSCSCVFLYRVGVHPIAAGAYKAAALARCAWLFTVLEISALLLRFSPACICISLVPWARPARRCPPRPAQDGVWGPFLPRSCSASFVPRPCWFLPRTA